MSKLKTHDKRGKPYSEKQLIAHAAYGAMVKARRAARDALDAGALEKPPAKPPTPQEIEALNPEALTEEGVKAALRPYVRGDK